MRINNIPKYLAKTEDTITVLHRKIVALDYLLTREESVEAAEAITVLQNTMNTIKERSNGSKNRS